MRVRVTLEIPVEDTALLAQWVQSVNRQKDAVAQLVAGLYDDVTPPILKSKWTIIGVDSILTEDGD